MVCSYTTSFSACFCRPEQDQCWSGWSVCKDFSLIWLNFLACLEVEWSMDSLWVKQTEAFLLVSTTYIHTSCLHTFFLHTFTNTHAFFLHTFANTHMPFLSPIFPFWSYIQHCLPACDFSSLVISVYLDQTKFPV